MRYRCYTGETMAVVLPDTIAEDGRTVKLKARSRPQSSQSICGVGMLPR